MSISGNTISTWNSSGRNIVTIGRQDGTSVAAMGSFLDNQPQFNSLGVASMILGVDEDAGRFQRIRSTISGSSLSASGTNFKLLTCVSGDAVKISGQTVATSVSGNFVNTSISGNVVSVAGSKIKAWDCDATQDVSGGIKLTNPTGGNVGPTPYGIRLKCRTGAITINSVDYSQEFSLGDPTVGYILESGESIFIPTNNPDSLRFRIFEGFPFLQWIAVNH